MVTLYQGVRQRLAGRARRPLRRARGAARPGAVPPGAHQPARQRGGGVAATADGCWWRLDWEGNEVVVTVTDEGSGFRRRGLGAAVPAVLLDEGAGLGRRPRHGAADRHRPRRHGAPRAQPAARRAGRGADPGGRVVSHGNILVVDDERGILDQLAGILRDEGFSVATVATGEEALRRSRARSSTWSCSTSGCPAWTASRCSGSSAPPATSSRSC